MVQNFQEDYEHGKQSEELSYPDLIKLFKREHLKHDPNCFAHFDYFDDEYMIELKTRDDVKVINGEFHYKTRAGRNIILDTLYFDAPKMRFAFQHNKRLKKKKHFFLVWKCNQEYYYWKLNWDKKDYYVEDQERDWGKGFQKRDVINVKVSAIKKLKDFNP